LLTEREDKEEDEAEEAAAKEVYMNITSVS